MDVYDNTAAAPATPADGAAARRTKLRRAGRGGGVAMVTPRRPRLPALSRHVLEERGGDGEAVIRYATAGR